MTGFAADNGKWRWEVIDPYLDHGTINGWLEVGTVQKLIWQWNGP